METLPNLTQLRLIAPFITAFLITVLATPLTIKFAKRYKLLDDPKNRPHPAHIQKRIVPRAGGLPIFIALTLSILIFIPFDKHVLGIILGTLVLLCIGLIDDLLPDFSPIQRLALQVIAASIVVLSGVGISFITNPFGGVLRLDPWVIPVDFFGRHHVIVIADFLAFVWIVWMMNMINWAKGVDGQMPGIVTVASLTVGLLSLRLFNSGDINQFHIAQLSFIVTGAAVGLLVFNWYPAKIFPGFSGSTILGFMIAVLSILSGAKLATALLVLLIPSIDFFYTFFRRVMSKKSPFLGDQKHMHHLLLKRGFSHRQISLFYIITCIILGLFASYLSTQSKLFISLGMGIIILGTILWLHHLYNSDTREEE
jgi:UDP-GlcNAc:undecaprenyl-phosphate/decaprenyl-phosphate GlcNAc-1-phosphate transferase